MTDIIILSLLLEGPKHGYRLKQEAARFSAQPQLHNNTVYPLLNRLLQDGWITQQQAGGERGQTRLLYELTLAGHHALVDKLSQFTDSDAMNGPAFRLRVGLFELLEPAVRLRILDLRDRHLAARLERTTLIGESHTIQGWAAQTFHYVMDEIRREREWIATLKPLATSPTP